jgi:hypothetical protein
MGEPIQVTLAVEGYTDEIVARKILAHVGLACNRVLGRDGKDDLLAKLGGYNNAAAFSNWFILLDLDDNDCPVTYFQEILPSPSANLILRIAVREIESWLMADREHLAKFLNIAMDNVPKQPDDEANPKETLLNLVKRCRKKALREDMLPTPSSGRRVGIGYANRISEFVTQYEFAWRPDVAAETSDSLHRCIKALEKLKSR